jgi:hypothetical protein
MPEVIEIKNCSDCNFIDRDEVKFGTDIIATNCTWRENETVDYTLQQQPVEGSTYLVVLHQPVRFSIKMQLWLFYDCPLAFYNGYERTGEIEQARFCFGEIMSLISQDDLSATVLFQVKQVVSLDNILSNRIACTLPRQWENTIKGCVETGKCYPEQFGDYYQLDLNFEGDLGLLCIVKKSGEDYFICLITEWCFLENFTYGGKYILPPFLHNRLMEHEKSRKIR